MKKKINFVFLIFSILATIFIFSNSMHIAEESGAFSGGLLSQIKLFLNSLGIPLFWLTHNLFRKLAHIFEFFMQGFFINMYFITKNKARYKASLMLGGLTACIDEFIQLFYPGRAAMIKDIFIDFSGALLAVIFCIFAKYILFDRRVK